MQNCTDPKEPTMNLHPPACNTTLGLSLSSPSAASASSVINMAPCAAATPPSSTKSNNNNNILQQQPPPVYATPFSAYNSAAMAPFQLHRFEQADQISSSGTSAGYGVCSTATRQAPPVQLELLPLRPAHATTAAPAPAPPHQYPHAAAMNPFISWQQQQRTAPQMPAAATMNMPMQMMMMSSHLAANASPAMAHHVRSCIDVNQIPPVAEGEDTQVAESSPTAGHAGFSSLATEAALCRTSADTASAGTTTQLLPKREREKLSSDVEQDRTCEVSSRASDEEAEGGGTRKKLRLSKEQSSLLEESFKEHSTLNPKQKAALAKQLNLRPRQVEVWFQNRRARTKLKQTEVDCELLKRCCESLTEENRRLQKEVQELRAIKVAPPCVIAHDLYMPLPAATLTMCPSCERLATLADNGRTLGFAKPTPPHHQALSQPSAAC